MNKKIILTLTLATTLSLSGCSGESNDQGNIDEQTQEDNQEQENKKQEIDIKIDELSFDILEIKEPDSEDNVYMINQFTNNSEYPVTGIIQIAMFKDDEETYFIDNFDTVMPGETSPKFETEGPKSQDEEDIELLDIEIRSQQEDGTDVVIDYDYKLKTYRYQEFE